VDYPSVAGNHGVAWDAVELPSQFMENWCWEWDVVKNLSQHYQTRKKLSKAKFDKLLAIKNFHSGLFMIRQLEFALFDLKLHINTETDRGKSTQRILDEVRQRVAVFSVPAFNRFQNSFEHIFNGGYDAGYFSYTWAEVLSSDAFEKFKENGTFNKEVGARFLHTILEQGGSREAMDLFVEFRGRKPTVDAMLKHRGIK
jgi:oligopeptidase A